MVEISRLYAKKPNVKRSNSSLRIQRKKSSQPLQSPADRILFLQRTIGNQAVQRLIKSGTLQTKLKIGQPGDKYEQEGDRVADAVMRMPEPGVQRQFEPEEEEEELIQTKVAVEQISPLVQRQIEEEEEEEPIQTKLISPEHPILQRQEEIEEQNEPLMTKGVSSGTQQVRNDLHSRLSQSKGGGKPLADADRNFMESRFGVDFSGVRLHTGSNAVQMSRELDAQAFTHGRDMYFGAGRYNPGTSSGKRLLVHELTHVVQQGQNDKSIPGHIHNVQTPSTLTIQKEVSTPQLILRSPIIRGVHPCERIRHQLVQVRRELHRVETQICNNQRSLSEAQSCEPLIEQWEDCRTRGAQECQPPSRCLTIGDVETYRRRLGELILRRNSLQQREQRLLEQIHRECGYDVPRRSPITC